jgi:hypothetical protein
MERQSRAGVRFSGLQEALAPGNDDEPAQPNQQMVPGVGVEPLGGLILRKLLILRNNKMGKNHKNAEVRYAAGTRRFPQGAIGDHRWRCIRQAELNRKPRAFVDTNPTHEPITSGLPVI